MFAGCGGLSEGMHQAGVAESRWAIEYEQPAADAFKLNNLGASVYCRDCSVVLAAAMQKAGLLEDCHATDEALAQAAGLSDEEVSQLPLPGEVEFMMGGPPCQGFSGMNRHSEGEKAATNNSMVLAYLSFADFYRPRFFLLENVRPLVTHRKGLTLRLVLRTLLDMGYQVRYGVLNAAHYGVPQSRVRTFIWAALPGETLPDWPQPLHAFRREMLSTSVNGLPYCAIDMRLPEGAPLRTVTVGDAIGDLPAIENGHIQEVMEYDSPPQSAYQAALRANAHTALYDHQSDDMGRINLERCRYIPKDTPGADWHVLYDVVKADPSKAFINGEPLIPGFEASADRNGGWRGLFGRLDFWGHFPTTVTNPRPNGKVGQVFHPHQDRIASVREYARSQGFPDSFRFSSGDSGNVPISPYALPMTLKQRVRAKYKQVGNAVPVPLAAALGAQLRAALQRTQAQQGQGEAQQQAQQQSGRHLRRA